MTEILGDCGAFLRVYAACALISFLAWPVIRLSGLSSLDYLLGNYPVVFRAGSVSVLSARRK